MFQINYRIKKVSTKLAIVTKCSLQVSFLIKILIRDVLSSHFVILPLGLFSDVPGPVFSLNSNFILFLLNFLLI